MREIALRLVASGHVAALPRSNRGFLMTKLIDLSGQRFGKLTVLEGAYVRRDRKTYWTCRCDCGAQVEVLAANLRRDNTRSCGCLIKDVAMRWTKHGLEGTKTYRAWQAMKNRCHNPKSTQYKHYGARGISVCARWRDDFETFLEDVGHPPSRAHSLDRIDNDGDYEPGNVRWATQIEQVNNRRSSRFIEFDGQRKTVAQWSRATGLGASTIEYRLKSGWLPEKALTTPGRKVMHSTELSNAYQIGAGV